MKKSPLLICSMLFLLVSHTALSQDTLKTLSGSWTAELNVNPLQGQISLNNAINQIKVRYFKANNVAYRLAFSINNVKRDDDKKSSYGTNPIDDSDVRKSTSFGLNFGIEKHFTGTRRLSPYIGGEIAFGLKSASETIDSKQSTTEIKGGWQDSQPIQYYNNGSYYYYTSITNTEHGYKSIGLNFVTGFDFYVAKHLFLGYEMLFGFNYIKNDAIITTVTPKPGQTNYNSGNNSPNQNSKERNFGPKVINGIRLGYTF